MFYNKTGRSVDAFEAFYSATQHLQPELGGNPENCQSPTEFSRDEHAPDFTYWFKVQWTSACVAHDDYLTVGLPCDAGNQCPPHLTYAGWTLAGKPVGQPCEPPGCGNVPCCNGYSCPTPPPPIPDTDHDGIPDANDNCPTVPNPVQRNRGSDGLGDLCNTPPGDLDCDFLVRPPDLLTLLDDLAGVSHDSSQLCTEIAAGRTRPLADLNCDGTVGVPDLVRLLRYEGGLPIDETGGCPAVGG